MAKSAEGFLSDLADFNASFPDRSPPREQLEQFISRQELEPHTGLGKITLPAYIARAAARRGLNGLEAVDSLIRLSSSELTKSELTAKRDIFGRLFDPPANLQENSAANFQRHNPLPTLTSISFGWEARAVFVPEENASRDHGRLAGYFPLVSCRLDLVSGRDAATESIVFQMDEGDLNRLLNALKTAAVHLAEMRNDLQGTKFLFADPPLDIRHPREDWEFSI